jgi:hypothetical protein
MTSNRIRLHYSKAALAARILQSPTVTSMSHNSWFVLHDHSIRSLPCSASCVARVATTHFISAASNTAETRVASFDSDVYRGK